MKNLIEAVKELASVEHIVKNFPLFDDFYDWVETDIGLSTEKRLKIFLNVEKEFLKAGYLDHAKIIRLSYEKLKLRKDEK